ncbi:hypothetical protein [Mucilaginibacter auburnensis]|uniref:hypothetical protein n=1 Tax=Mucilaginibacter auburnensis TaxID=1457233 RepID=UPI0012FDE188|nr:hypothetical protein [Mucilaginibacter auburnensis]
MKRETLTCPACHQAFHHRTKRSWFMKYVLYFLPFRVYFCDRCDKDVYVLFREHHPDAKAA